MTEEKWVTMLSTTEKNNVGSVLLRKNNENSEVMKVKLIKNSKPYDLTALKVFFVTHFSGKDGLNNPVQKEATIINAKEGIVEFIFDQDCMQKVGRQQAYFEIYDYDKFLDATQNFTYEIISSSRNVKSDFKESIGTWAEAEKMLSEGTANNLNRRVENLGLVKAEKKEVNEELSNLNRRVENLGLVKADLKEVNIQNEKVLVEVSKKANQDYVESMYKSMSSGKPTEVLKTVNELKTKYPNGTNGTIRVLENNHFYFWDENKKMWIDAGIYPEFYIEEESIENINLKNRFLLPTKNNSNYFLKDRIIYGMYIDDTGRRISNPEWFISDLIEMPLHLNILNKNRAACVIYDESKQFISYHPISQIKVNLPSNKKYIALTAPIINIDSVQLNFSEDLLPYEKGQAEVDISQIHNFEKETKQVALENEYDSENIKDGAILEEKTIFFESGKNLFNKQTAKKGYYIDYSSGIERANADYWASKFIELEYATEYYKNSWGQFALYDADKKYVKGYANNVLTFSTDDKIKYVRLSIFNGRDNIDAVQLEKGSKQTSFEEFGYKLKKDYLPKIEIMIPATTVTVAKNGGDFKTINEALQSIDDSVNKQMRIEIAEGIYEETVNLWGRYVTLNGVNPYTTKIINYLNDYYKPPLDGGPNSFVNNLGIIAGKNDNTPENGVNNMPSYGLHFDLSGRSLDLDDPKYQGVSKYKNCIFYSEYQHAVALGLSKNIELIFEDCEMFSPTSRSFRGHGYMPAENATGQKLTLIRNRIWNSGDLKPLVLQDPNLSTGGDTTDTIFTFQNNVLWNDNGQSDVVEISQQPKTPDDIVGNIKLGKGSFGNNSSLLNIIK